MITLNTLFNNPGAKRDKKRVGRGIGSGKGKTCGKGTKGQKARAGVAVKGFEGGQTPLIKRLPKRGFNCLSSTNYIAVNLVDLERLVIEKRINPASVINKEQLVVAGLIKSVKSLVKLLGNGQISHKLNIQLDAYSKSAKELVEKAGGSVL